jgi:hypothetical protein
MLVIIGADMVAATVGVEGNLLVDGSESSLFKERMRD